MRNNMFNRSIPKPIRPLLLMCIVHCFNGSFNIHANFATLAKNDPFPLFESIDPQTYLLTKEKLYYTEPDWAEKKEIILLFLLALLPKLPIVGTPLVENQR